MKEKEDIDQLVQTFFASFVSSDHGNTDLNVLLKLFLPEANVIKLCGAPSVSSVSEFLSSRQRILSDGSLLRFSEKETCEQTLIFGDLAQRVCVYEKSGLLDGQLFAQKGVKTFQFVRIGRDWKIAALSWDDESSDRKIPDDFLRRGGRNP